MTNPLMEYLPPVSQQKQAPGAPANANGAGKYHGAIAAGYDAKRVNDPKWTTEQNIIEGMLSELPAGSVVFDCPVGTGRFLNFYKGKDFRFIGVDLSGDMLVQSALKLLPEDKVAAWVDASNKANTILPLRIKDVGVLLNGDVRKIGLPDKSVDAAVLCRLTRWLSPDDCKVAMRELQRITRKRIIWTARVANHPHARTVELFESALQSGWKISRNEAGYMMDYRILMAEPV